MAKAVAVKKSTTAWESPPVKLLDEAVWQAWKAKARDRDRKGRETRIKVLKGASIVALLAVAALWSQLTRYEIVIRCVLASAAAAMMFETFNKRQYGLGAVFGGLALLYNPVAPVLSFSGNWQRALVVASTIPFITSLTWRDLKAAHID
jgi:4-hydroxybenzoate polyprenyltransferase